MLGIGKLAKKVFGSANDRQLKSVSPIVEKINSLEIEMQKLTNEELAGKTNDYKAHFQTSICLTISQTEHIFFEGTVRGKISKKIKGSMGFGYDPIFIPDGEKNTFAEMDINEKNLKSHRAIAIQKLKKYILKNF